jgi:hypothetical protein
MRADLVVVAVVDLNIWKVSKKKYERDLKVDGEGCG